MGNRKIESAIILSTLAVMLFIAVVFLTREDEPVLAQGAPSGSESSAPVDGPRGEKPVTMPEEEAIDRAGIGADATATIADLRIMGSALKPRADDVSYQAAPVETGGGCLYASAGFAERVFNAPVYLPQGSKVLAVRMFYNDTNSSVNSIGWFTVYDQFGNIAGPADNRKEWIVFSDGAVGNGFSDTRAINHTLDYTQYSYAVNWRPVDLGSDMQLCGFRIFYEPPPFGLQFLPNAMKP